MSTNSLTPEDIQNIADNMRDQAFDAALLFELLSAVFSSLACNRKDDYANALIRLNQRPQLSFITTKIAAAFEAICDDGSNDTLSKIASDIYEALTGVDVEEGR